jgi:hypothetical protein
MFLFQTLVIAFDKAVTDLAKELFISESINFLTIEASAEVESKKKVI